MVPRNDERQAVEAEYAQRLQAGPDFTQCQVGSGFEEAPLHRLDAGDKRQVLAAFDAVREWHARKAHEQGVSLRYTEALRFLLRNPSQIGY